jgi:multiple sugar transport system permease protein
MGTPMTRTPIASGGIARAAAERARTSWLRRTAAANVPGYVFLLPWLIGFLGLTLGPALASFYFSFTHFDLLTPPRWIGTRNYDRLFTGDPRFWNAVLVTSTYVLLAVPLKLAFALGVAVAMDKGIRGLSLYRALFYLPSLLGASVTVSVLWRRLFVDDGVVNQALGWIGLPHLSWISNPHTSLYVMITLSIWQFGTPMIIFLAGLRQVPQEVYDAAEVDGASKVQQFWKITLPLLGPVVFFNLVLQTIDAFKAFTQAFIMSDGTGRPADSLLFYTLYMYDQAFVSHHMGYASALAWVLVVGIGAVTTLTFWSSRYWVHYDDAR